MIRFIMPLVAMIAFATPALAEELPLEYTAEMWNADPNDRSRKMVFSEDVITVAPGASVTWLATDRGHNVEFIDGPDGVELDPKSKLNSDVTITFAEPGVYVYVCTPHATMGMIGIVIVGEATPEAIAAVADARLRGASKKKFEALISELD
jgi:Plastocyanin